MRKYTEDERYEIKRVLDKVFDILENTDNDVFMEVGFIGVELHAYAGKMDMDDPDQKYAISETIYRHYSFTKAHADRMISELDVLGNFNRVEKKADTAEDQ